MRSPRSGMHTKGSASKSWYERKTSICFYKSNFELSAKPFENLLLWNRLKAVHVFFIWIHCGICWWFCNCGLSNIILKNDIFEACFRQSAKGEITAWEAWQYRVVCKHLDFSIWFLQLKPRFPPPLLRFLRLINSLQYRYVPCMYDTSNTSNISTVPYILPYNGTMSCSKSRLRTQGGWG